MAVISSSMTAADATVSSAINEVAEFSSNITTDAATTFSTTTMGAECLIRFEAAPTYRSGAILAIKPRGWQWGTEEMSDRFIRVTVTDAGPVDLEQYLGAQVTLVNEGTAEQTTEIVNKRLYYLDSVAVANVAAQPGRQLVTNKASVDNFMRNIVDHG